MYYGLAPNIQSGSAILIAGNASNSYSAFTGNYINVNPTRNHTGGSINDTGHFLNIARANQYSGSGTYTISGDLVNFSSNETQTSGTLTDTANILELNQQYAAATGDVLNILNSATTNSLINLSGSTLTSGNLIKGTVADTLTTGTALLNFTGTALDTATSVILEQLSTTPGYLSWFQQHLHSFPYRKHNNCLILFADQRYRG